MRMFKSVSFNQLLLLHGTCEKIVWNSIRIVETATTPNIGVPLVPFYLRGHRHRDYPSRSLTKASAKNPLFDNEKMSNEEEAVSRTRATEQEAAMPTHKTKMVKRDRNEGLAGAVTVETEKQLVSSPTTRGKKKSNEQENNNKDDLSTQHAKKKKKTASSNSGTSTTMKPNSSKTAQSITERDPLPKLWHADPKNKNNFKIISWNVNGIRAVLKNHPNALVDLANVHKPDLICLQETKIQEIHVTDPKLELKGMLLDKEGYDSYWSCSTTKKGYSGTAVFIKRYSSAVSTSCGAPKAVVQQQQKTLQSFFKKKHSDVTMKESVMTMPNNNEEGDLSTNDNLFIPVGVSYGLDDSCDTEGRCITIDYQLFSIINTYVPNAGDNLVRLDYRTKEWDVQLGKAMKLKEEKRGLPVILLGDLNVAHKSLDAWNDGAPHLKKCAGTTPEERESFTKLLGSYDFVDLFRHVRPQAKGHYTFWSTRAGNRPSNKGLRLDYFVASKKLTDNDKSLVVARDSYMIHDQLGSDHCPIVLELEIKDNCEM